MFYRIRVEYLKEKTKKREGALKLFAVCRNSKLKLLASAFSKFRAPAKRVRRNPILLAHTLASIFGKKKQLVLSKLRRFAYS